MPWEASRGAIKFDVSQLNHAGIVEIIKDMTDLGVKAFRFIRQVPPTIKYPEGVSSTDWINLAVKTQRQISNFIGGMLHPGVDFVKTMVMLEDDVPLMPPSMRTRMQAALDKLG